MKGKGFLFDLDGTLVDSLPAVERNWIKWGSERGIPAEEILAYIHGKQAITSLRHFMQGATEGEILHAHELLEQQEAEDTSDVVPLPGAIDLLSQLAALSIPWAIVTSGSLPVATARCRAAGIPEPGVLVTAEMVQRGKPEPDAYLLGAKLLLLEPEECIVVEDAPAGILSGLTAGSHVIAVNAPDSAARLAEVSMRLNSLEELLINKGNDGVVDVYRRH